jgi:hypothetical protein
MKRLTWEELCTFLEAVDGHAPTSTSGPLS